ncbi:MAG: autotransporter outer membrane beta-barrel domain-containing protein [Planctomycetaceae bacterium]|jgi:uncharacterized protein with beta-barrel porin domain|nr:autotransporter outer membrane beta-barrel domain-containing protein [Planctomycetaceae bacterium]
MEKTVLTRNPGNYCFGLVCGLTLFLFALFVLPELYAQAVPRVMTPVQNQAGETVILLDFWGTDDDEWGFGYTSSWNFSQQEQDSIVEAAQYWVNILKPTGQMPVVKDLITGETVIDPATGQPMRQPVIIRIGNNNDADMAGNAFAASNGFVLSGNSSTFDSNYTVAKPQGLIADSFYIEGDENNPHAIIGIGTGWNTAQIAYDQSGRVAQDLSPVVIHEIGHALGISCDADVEIDIFQNTYFYTISEQLTRWASRMRDANGRLAQPGLIVGHPGEYEDASLFFDIGDTNAYHQKGEVVPSPTFVGQQTLELWYGKPLDKLTNAERNVGIPVAGLVAILGGGRYGEDTTIWDYNGVLSHLDTTNTLMTHQFYRNYNGLIEIELAAMQDIGYTIERRDLFGKSYYQDGNGTQVRNTTSFSKWNYQSGSYAGTPNQNSFAIGTHLFAKNLNILQIGDILADGPGSAGIRIDGSNNKVNVDRDTVIITGGTNGIGVLAAYGKEHNIIHQGYIKADGLGGKGISINFGLPTIDQIGEVVGMNRGSYYYVTPESVEGFASPVETGYWEELNGALVNNLDITGTIIADKTHSSAIYGFTNPNPDDDDTGAGDAGTDDADTGGVAPPAPGEPDLMGRYWLQSKEFHLGAAVYIDQTAHLANLNIMNGAKIEGDILSFWDYDADNTPFDADPSKMIYRGKIDTPTKLTFGLKAAADGSATQTVDPNFRFTYSGNINYFRYELYPNIVTEWDPATNTYIPYQPLIDEEDPFGDDTFWEFLTWDDGFFFTDGKYLTIERDYVNNKVYAGFSTPGVIDMRFAAGTTEFIANRAYVNNLTVDNGATLVLTSDSSTGIYREPEIHVATSWQWDDEDYNNWKTERLQRQMTNNGRIAGDGAFFVGGLTPFGANLDPMTLERVETIYVGRFNNNGTLSPGAKNGAEIGKISIHGDLQLSQSSIYEATVGRTLLTDNLGNPVDRDGNRILSNGNVVNADGTVIRKNQLPIYIDSSDVISVYTSVRQNGWESNDNLNSIAHDPDKVYPQDLIVGGNVILGGTLKVNVTADSVLTKTPIKFNIIEIILPSAAVSDNNNVPTIAGQFDKIISNTAFLTILPDLEIKRAGDTIYGSLLVSRNTDYFKQFAKTSNEAAAANVLDNSLLGFDLANPANKASDLRDIYRQMGAHIRANSVFINLWTPSELVFNRIGWGNGQMSTGDRGRVNWDRIKGRNQRMLGQEPGCRNRTGSLWGDYFNATFNADADVDGNSSPYNITRNGFMIGGEKNLTPYSAIGGIASYADSNLRQSGDKIDSDDYVLGAYFVCAPFNEFEVKSYLGLGFQEYAMNRYVRNENIYASSDGIRGINDRYYSETQGSTLNLAFEFARPLMLHQTFILRPTLGFDFQWLWQDGFQDKDFSQIDANYGSYRYALRYDRMKFNRSLMRLGFSSETTGVRGGIRMRTFYVSNLANNGTPSSTVSFIGDGQQFTVSGVAVGKNFLNLGVGANLWFDGEKTGSLFVDYDANLYTGKPKADAHTFSIGVLQNF